MWIDLIKKHISDEVAYSVTMKSRLCNLVDSTPSADPQAFFNSLIDKVNGSGEYRSRELCKWLGRVCYQWNAEKARLPAGQAITLLENLISGRR